MDKQKKLVALVRWETIRIAVSWEKLCPSQRVMALDKSLGSIQMNKLFDSIIFPQKRKRPTKASSCCFDRWKTRTFALLLFPSDFYETEISASRQRNPVLMVRASSWELPKRSDLRRTLNQLSPVPSQISFTIRTRVMDVHALVDAAWN